MSWISTPLKVAFAGGVVLGLAGRKQVDRAALAGRKAGKKVADASQKVVQKAFSKNKPGGSGQ